MTAQHTPGSNGNDCISPRSLTSPVGMAGTDAIVPKPAHGALFPVSADQVGMTKDEWYTPRWLFDAAGLTFDMDVCAPVAPEFRTCPARQYLTVIDDGLTHPWEGVIWCNPPYSNPAPWVDRWAQHPTGLALVPASNSHWRGRYMRAAHGLTLLSVNANERRGGGFGRPDGSQVNYPVALILAARGAVCVSVLKRVAAADVYAGGAWFERAS